MDEKIKQLIGKDKLELIKKTNILIVGIGGVGGTALEALIRSGFSKITIIDYDIFEESNLNRQIISNLNNLNNKKVIEAKKRCLSINNKASIIYKDIFLNKDNINELGNYDYLIDACDSINTKLELIKYALKKKIKIISCMGMGNRLDPSKVSITMLKNTEYDPLAKKLRLLLNKENISLNIPVVSSLEKPIKNEGIASMMIVPSCAGLYLAYYVINDLLNK